MKGAALKAVPFFLIRRRCQSKSWSPVSHCKRLRAAGLEPRERMPVVRPAARRQMGGVAIDADGQTGVAGPMRLVKPAVAFTGRVD